MFASRGCRPGARPFVDVAGHRLRAGRAEFRPSDRDADRRGRAMTSPASQRRAGPAPGGHARQVPDVRGGHHRPRGCSARASSCLGPGPLGGLHRRDASRAPQDDSAPLATEDLRTHPLRPEQAPHGHDIFENEQDGSRQFVLRPKGRVPLAGSALALTPGSNSAGRAAPVRFAERSCRRRLDRRGATHPRDRRRGSAPRGVLGTRTADSRLGRDPTVI
jgi:hypothetical protein